MKYILTGKQMRNADQFTINEIGIPSVVLMEKAAMGVAEVVKEHADQTKAILIVCGLGNNGGDGYAVARLLHLEGYKVSIFFLGKEESRSEENKIQKKICEHYRIPVVEDIDDKEYSVIVDAVFGTGLSRNIEGYYAEVIESLNQKNGLKIAVDISSGIHDSTGQILGVAFMADITVAIAYMKRGIVLQPGNGYSGKVEIVDIGIHNDAITDKNNLMFAYDKEDLVSLMPRRKKNSHKGSYGKVGLIVGSKGMSGAAYLSAKAAYLTGAGLVNIYTHEDNRAIMQSLVPEAIVTTYTSFDEEKLKQFLEWSSVTVIGCGLGQSELSRQILEYTVKNTNETLVIDADGLNLLSEDISLLDTCRANVVLTPHMKEMTRLLNCDMKSLQENRIELLQKFVEEYPVTCVLKDARTVAAKQNESLYVNMSGNAAMAKGGSGDVLAGMIAGLLAQDKKVYQMATLGAFLHGLAGDKAREYKGSYSVLATDIIYAVVEVLKEYFA